MGLWWVRRLFVIILGYLIESVHVPYMLNFEMICPHCRTTIHASLNPTHLGFCGKNPDGLTYSWDTILEECPACKKPIVFLSYKLHNGKFLNPHSVTSLVFPKHSTRQPAPQEVPLAIANDYNEAALVLDLSPQASAALSRRCLQHLLENSGLSKNNNLNKAIEEAMGKNLPSYITESLDSIRAIGNFAAHTQKSVNTGEILPVEPHEAEWNLEVLDMLFDFCYVHPAKNAARRAALDAKLAEAGKPPLK